MKNNSGLTVRLSFLPGDIPVVIRPSVVVALLYTALISLIAITRNLSALDFVHVGTVWANHNPSGTWGYDGQFYYQLARNPLQAYQFMDNAAYRYQHALYALVAGVLSLGRPVLIPYTLLFVNVLSIILSVEIISRLLVKYGFSPWFSLALGFYFGQAAAILFDTAEPFTYFLICLGVWLLEEKHLTWAAFLMGAATLSRESAVLFPAGFVCFFLVRKQWQASVQFAVFGILPLPFLLFCLHLIFGKTGITFTPPFERLPFAGLFFYAQAPRKIFLLVLLILLPTLAAWLLAAIHLFQRGWNAMYLILLLNLALITFLSRSSYIDLVSCGRLSIGLVLAVLLYGISTRKTYVLWASQCYALTFLAYSVGTLLHVASFLA